MEASLLEPRGLTSRRGLFRLRIVTVEVRRHNSDSNSILTYDSLDDLWLLMSRTWRNYEREEE